LIFPYFPNNFLFSFDFLKFFVLKLKFFKNFLFIEFLLKMMVYFLYIPKLFKLKEFVLLIFISILSLYFLRYKHHDEGGGEGISFSKIMD